jgi:16S rRNA (guanine527-N7)-methyltransferase
VSSAARPEVAPELLGVLAGAQRLGYLGARPIDQVVEHARRFVDALSGVTGTVVDLGSGGGVPGLVVAHDRPDLVVTLLDRRTSRTDFLERMVARLEWGGRVTVRSCDALDLAREVELGDATSFDAAVARGFGPPDATLVVGARLVGRAGVIVISEPPGGHPWDAILAEHPLAVRREAAPGGVAMFRVE